MKDIIGMKDWIYQMKNYCKIILSKFKNKLMLKNN